MPINDSFALELRLMSSPQASNGKKKREFDPTTFLATIGAGRKNVAVAKKKLSLPKGMGRTRSFISNPAR
jgi:hypothetical protein